MDQFSNMDNTQKLLDWEKFLFKLSIDVIEKKFANSVYVGLTSGFYFGGDPDPDQIQTLKSASTETN